MLTGTFAQVNVQFSEIFELFLEIVTVHALHKQQRFIDIFRQNVYDKAIKICNETLIFRISERGML